MAKLGVHNLDELVGRSDLIKVREDVDPQIYGKLDLSAIVENPYLHEEKHLFMPKDVYDFGLQKTIDEKVFLKEFKSALAGKKKEVLRLMYAIQIVHWVQFSVPRSPRSMVIHCRKISTL